jgi:hypothetical protein
MQKKETLTLTINNKKVAVDHSWDVTTGRSLDKQTTGLKDLTTFLKEEIEKNKTDGFIPYNNFESSIHWKIKEAA